MAFLFPIGGRTLATQGMLLWGALGLVANFVMYWFSDRLALAAHRAQPVSGWARRVEHPGAPDADAAQSS